MGNILKEFSDNISHEFRTPLTSILGYSEIITNSMYNIEDMKLFAGKINKEAVHLSKIIDDMMLISSAESEMNIGTTVFIYNKFIYWIISYFFKIYESYS